MKVTLDSHYIYELLKLSKADNISVIVNSEATYLIANEIDDISLKTQLVRKIKTTGIEGKTLVKRDVLKLIPDNTKVTITETQIKTNNRLISYKPNDLVDDPIVVNGYFITVSGASLIDLLTCRYAIAQDETRPILAGMCMHENDFVALDGFRASVRTGSFEINEDVVINRNLVNIISKIKYKDDICIKYNDNFVEFVFGDLSVVGNRLNGNYIKYKSFIPDGFNTEIQLNSKELLSVLKTYKASKFDLVKLETQEGKLLVKTYNQISTIEDEVKANISGDNVKIAFNIQYLIDALKNYKGSIKLKTTNSISPAVITQGSNKLDLILPVRIKEDEKN